MKYIAKQYVEALRASAADADTFRHLIADLVSVAEHLASDPKVHEFFASATIASAQQETVLRDVFKDFLGAQTYAFLHTLIGNRQFNLLSEIIARAEQIADAEEGSSRVTVESAKSLKSTIRTRIESLLSARLQRRVLMMYEERPELIAGFRVTVNGTQHWDGTVSGKLQRLREHLRVATL